MRNRSQTEQAILDAARALIAEGGFADWGVNALAARCGCDKVLIYRYFNGLDGVLERLADLDLPQPPELDERTEWDEWLLNFHDRMIEDPFWLAVVRWIGAGPGIGDNPLTLTMTRHLQQVCATWSRQWVRSDGASSTKIIMTVLHWSWRMQLQRHQVADLLSPLLPQERLVKPESESDLQWEELPPEML